MTPWKNGTPESAGIPSKALLEFVCALDSYEHLHSFMLIRNGINAASGWWKPYDPQTPHLLFSLSKSFVSCAIGFAVAEKRVELDTPLLDIFPEYRSIITDDRFRQMTIRHLLTMASGHGVCSTNFFQRRTDGDFVRDFFLSPLEFTPGERFVYNSGATFMLSAAIRRLTGENPVDYLKPRMLDALNIPPRHWEKSPDGTDFGGWGYRLTTGEIASFAMMLLNQGKVGGRQILPREYFDLAVSRQIDNSMNEAPDWKQGYGFQFWRCRHNAFRGDGAFGQYALAVPEKNMILATTSGGRNMQMILDMVWDILLPALKNAPLPEDPASYALLQEKIASLSLPQLSGKAPGCRKNISADFHDSGEFSRIHVSLSPEDCTLTFQREGKQDEILRAGWQMPVEGVSHLEADEPRPVSATAAVEDGKLKVRAYFYSTPFATDYIFSVSEKKLILNRERNLYFFQAPWEELQGTLLPESSIRDFYEID